MTILDEEEAVSFALENALPGDLVVIFYESYEKVLNVVEAFSKSEKQQKNNLYDLPAVMQMLY